MGYRSATPLEHRVMNASFFERIEIAPGAPEVALTPVYGA